MLSRFFLEKAVVVSGESFDGVDEGDASDEDDKVDVVEVSLAGEASGEIGFRIGSGVELLAGWALEAKTALDVFCGDA